MPVKDFSLEEVCQSSKILKNLRAVILSHCNETARKFGMSIIYLLENEEHKLLECLQKIAEANPDVPLIQRRIAEVYINRENYKQAAEHLEKVLKLDEDDLTAQVWLSLIYFKLKETKKADDILKELQSSVFLLQVNKSWY